VEVGEDPDAGSYLVCEFVPGQDLKRFVREKGPQPAWWTIDVMIQVLAGLHFLHTRPGVIVHRDVKPDNVLLKLENAPATTAPLAKLADFGVSRALEGPGSTRLTEPGAVPGTLSYLAPEIFSGKPYGPAADVYSAGVTAYYVLTGKHPYDFPREGGDVARLYHLLSNSNLPIPVQARLPSVPASAAGVIDKACSKDPGCRYPSALEFAEALMQTR
jgi:serine/threonine-protein kinase